MAPIPQKGQGSTTHASLGSSLGAFCSGVCKGHSAIYFRPADPQLQTKGPVSIASPFAYLHGSLVSVHFWCAAPTTVSFLLSYHRWSERLPVFGSSGPGLWGMTTSVIRQKGLPKDFVDITGDSPGVTEVGRNPRNPTAQDTALAHHLSSSHAEQPFDAIAAARSSEVRDGQKWGGGWGVGGAGVLGGWGVGVVSVWCRPPTRAEGSQAIWGLFHLALSFCWLQASLCLAADFDLVSFCIRSPLVYP